MPKVSIIVPVYNAEKYIRDALDSLVNQTLRDIEIVCCDDCSTDGSGAILDEYAMHDSRIRVIHYPQNKTAAQARKDGALAATGNYILFMDNDDWLEPDTCEKLSALMEKTGTDMIQFGTNVIKCTEMPESRYQGMVRMLEPYNGKLNGNILNACFVEQKYQFTIWNKMYKASLVKKAMALFPDGRFPMAEDVFAFFLIAYFAKSYIGMPKLVCYNYRFGAGFTGHDYVDRAAVKRIVDEVFAANGIRDFLLSQNALETYRESYEMVRKRLTNDSLSLLTNHMTVADVPFAFDVMCRAWGAPVVIGYLSENQAENKDRWARLLKDADTLNTPPRKVKRIGSCYPKLNDGGTERVMAELAGLWTKMGYEVVLFTDSDPSPEDYPVPDCCRRVVLPSSIDPKQCAQRAEVLYDAVRASGIDLFVTHAWMNEGLLWDLLTVKAAGALCYVHTHGVFSMPLTSASLKGRFFDMQSVYTPADGVIVLSRTDQAYWRHFNSRVFCVVNPLTFDIESTPQNSLDGKTVLWVGRFSPEKNLVHAVKIMSRVLQKHPDAHMKIVGGGPEAMVKNISGEIKRLQIGDRVELCGFHTDVEPFYRQGDVLLCTSRYEGFCLSIQEAESHGIPCVAYEMPYLSLLETGKGCCQVPMGDMDAAAECICRLFDDRALLKKTGADARQNVLDVCNVDFEAQWREILESAEQPKAEPDPDDCERLVLNTITTHAKDSGIGSFNSGSCYAPMPEHGPFKTLRKKCHTALRIFAQYGVSGMVEHVRQKQLYRAARNYKR